MPLALSVIVCLLLSLPLSDRPIRASFPVIAQASQSEAPPDNSNPQHAGQETNPAQPPAAAAEQNAPPNAPTPDAAKPSQGGKPGETPAPAESSPATAQEPQTAQPVNATEAPKAKPPQLPKNKSPYSAKGKTAHRTQKAKPATAPAQPGTPSKVVVKNGSAAEPGTQLAPGLSQQQASSQRQGTSQLLASTDEDLKKISGRQLASNQQEMVQQVRKYMEQAKAATVAGDLDRAHSLALKASLLAQALAKP